MRQHAGYQLEVLRPGKEFTLYRGRTPDEQPVLALAATGQWPSQRNTERLLHEKALATELDSEWAARPLALVRYDGRQILLLEDCGGEPLDIVLERTSGQPFDMTSSLRLAGNLASAVGQMHRQGLIHKDIKPANILVDETGRVRLTGFGIASRLRSERQAPAPPEIIAGTFAYMAPEQTGRMNRSMDARSDLYSLGVTLYEVFTGRLPFVASEPMEWIHCHIARQPLAPSERANRLPPAIDGIILKLLAKNPEDRYRTAAGVEADLRRCLSAWEDQGTVEAFELGQHDVSDRLLIPEKLYGREAEIETLLAAFERLTVSGASQMAVVSGYAGIGKSSIVNELHKVLVPQRGLFATGKFDQYKRDIPYATLAQAFQGLVRQLLSKDTAELAIWRYALLAALGQNGQLMINLIPELALVIGEQPPVQQVDPQSAQARFHLVFCSLLGVFANSEHPLVLFIDDLQWLDTATLALLQRLVTDPEVRHLMLIGAYRDNEVSKGHPLLTTLAAIRSARGAISEITLGPLQVRDLAELCADALDTDVRRVIPLAELVFEKTAGNPFFALQFIKALVDEGLLTFRSDVSAWQWDVGRIRAKGITDNVAHLMSAKLSRLPAGTRKALSQLACLGNVADVLTVALVRESSPDEVHTVLRDAVEAGLILHVNQSFAFIHDRVQEAAYALIPESKRAAAHLRIGRVLLSKTPPADLEGKIFEIVNQFERGASAITELELVAELELIAGKRAKTSSAYASAQAYFAAGTALLGDGSWQRSYRLTFDLELNRAECEIVCAELAAAESRLATLGQHAATLKDEADVVCLAVLLYFTTARSERAVEVALGFLARVGILWSSHPTEEEVRQEYLEMRRQLARRPMDTLIDLPSMSDPRCLATMGVLTELFPAAYAVDRNLLELVLLRMTNLSLEHGHCESSSVAYSALNMALGWRFSDYATAFRLGQLACDLVDRRGADRFKARVYSCFAAFTMPWIKHVPLCQPLMTQAFQIGSSMGDMAFASYNSRNLITHLLVSGVRLSQVQREAEQALAFARTIELGLAPERFIRQLELVEKLRGVAAAHRPADDEWAMHDVEKNPQLAMMVCYHWVFRLQEHFFAGNFSAALEAAAYVEPIRWAMRSSIEEAEYDFYAALTCAVLCEGAPPARRQELLQALTRHHARIVVWAENCPENFANRKLLVGAEISRLEGREVEAQNLYEEAVLLARQHGFVHNEGLANELAGKFHEARGLKTIADAYLHNARECYERWGGLVKLRQLDQQYPQLRAAMVPGSSAGAVDRPVTQLDVEAVDKASQTLSSEMVLPSLLEKLMRLAVEHAGAERGLLILLHGAEPHIEASATTGYGRVEVVVRRVPVTPFDLPQSALHYVLRTHERVVLDDASAQGLDLDDQYVSRNQPRSVLCLPILKQTKAIGALYLENNLTTRAFTPGSVAVLDFLASQAAIWLENARLYSDLQRNEAWLQEAQRLSRTGSFHWRVPPGEITWSTNDITWSAELYRIFDLDPTLPVTLELIATRVHPEDIGLLYEMIDRTRDGGDFEYEFRLRLSDGSVKYLHSVSHRLQDQTGRVDYIGAVQDVTERRRSEEALGEARSQLAHVARMTTLGVLTASIAHEVNQPLLGIITNASTCLRMLAADPPNIDGARKTAERSIRDGNRAADVITRLRALFGKKDTTAEPMDLNEAAREVLALSSNELQRNQVTLQVELAGGLPLVIGDRVQLQQVMLNLFLNASEAMSDVRDSPRKLLIRTELAEGDCVRLSVKDAGVGLDPHGVDRLFHAFYTTKDGGMGMGLSVSRSIIERHRGRLWAAPNDGPGSTFSFSIPVASDEAMSAQGRSTDRLRQSVR